jgi:DNA-binding transcriptional LysR family regulator
VLADHGREIVDRLTLAQLEAEALRRGGAGTYRVAAFPSACRTFVADSWAALLADGVGIRLQVTSLEPDEAIAALITGRTDLAIIHSYTNTPRRLQQGVHAETIFAESVKVALRTDDPVAGEVVDLADLENHAWIVPDQLSSCFEMVERACGLAGFRPRVVGQSGDFAAQLAFVAAGAGVAIIPPLAVADVPEGVTLAPLATQVQRHTIAVRRASMKGDPALDGLVNLLREKAGRWTGSEAPSAKAGGVPSASAADASAASSRVSA